MFMCKDRKKITMLLGAGVSCYFDGVSTEQINQCICDDSQASDNAEKELGRKLFEYLRETYEADINFETVLAVIERLLDYNFGKGTRLLRDKSIDTAIFEVHDNLLCLSDALCSVEGCWNLYRDYINRIISLISKNAHSETTRGGKYDSFLRLVKYLLESDYRVKIYSTNYDGFVQSAISQMKGYYEGCTKIDLRAGKDSKYEMNLKKMKDSCLTYFPLHGSIYLKRDPFSTFKSTMPVPVRLENAIDMNSGDISHPIFFTPIITGYSKASHINGSPFNFGFAALANDLNESTHVLVMGFSFKDKHINSFLTSLCDRKIDVVDLNGEDETDSSHERSIYSKLSTNMELGKTCFSGIDGFIDKGIYKEWYC